MDLSDVFTVGYDFLPDATHFLQLEQPEQCVAAMREFLRRDYGMLIFIPVIPTFFLSFPNALSCHPHFLFCHSERPHPVIPNAVRNLKSLPANPFVKSSLA